MEDNLGNYNVLGVDRDGHKDLLGMYISKSEGANFWLQVGRDSLSGEVYIFINRQRNTVKILHWERGGLVIYHKRLESGQFERPYFDGKKNAFQMRWSELVMIIEGLSMKNIVQHKRFDMDWNKNQPRSNSANRKRHA